MLLLLEMLLSQWWGEQAAEAAELYSTLQCSSSIWRHCYHYQQQQQQQQWQSWSCHFISINVLGQTDRRGHAIQCLWHRQHWSWRSTFSSFIVIWLCASAVCSHCDILSLHLSCCRSLLLDHRPSPVFEYPTFWFTVLTCFWSVFVIVSLLSV